jgi:uncharacterized protein YdbL (DUF1318 family)
MAERTHTSSPLLLAVLGLGLAGLTSCAPTVNLATPAPIKFDVGVRLDIYQKSPPKPKNEETALQIAYNRRTRSGEIQQLKNDRVVGEDRDGYLDLRNLPSNSSYAAYAKDVINSENADRTVLYLANAQSQSRPLEMVESDYAKLWYDRAFPGEWVQKEDGSWIQK